MFLYLIFVGSILYPFLSSNLVLVPPPPHVDKRVWVWVLPLKSFGNSTDIHQHHLVSLNNKAVITCQGDIVELGLDGCDCLEQS